MVDTAQRVSCKQSIDDAADRDLPIARVRPVQNLVE